MPNQMVMPIRKTVVATGRRKGELVDVLNERNNQQPKGTEAIPKTPKFVEGTGESGRRI